MALKENYRELLIDAVVRVAAREGLDRTTTKLIAAEVPCNEVYIYRNFGSKDALLQAAFSRTDLRFVQTILKNLDVMDAPGQPLEQRCRALWEPVWRFCLAQPDDIRFYLRYYYSAQFLASAHELHHRNYPGGETRKEFYDRCVEGIKACADMEKENLIIVAHKGTIQNIIFYWLGFDIEEVNKYNFSVDILPGSVTVLGINKWLEHSIFLLNDTSHLHKGEGYGIFSYKYYKKH